LAVSQQAVSADIIPNSDVGIFSPKTEGTKTKAARVLIRWLQHKFRSLYFAHLATLISSNS
jgi:hypothetical protein